VCKVISDIPWLHMLDDNIQVFDCRINKEDIKVVAGVLEVHILYPGEIVFCPFLLFVFTLTLESDHGTCRQFLRMVSQLGDKCIGEISGRDTLETKGKGVSHIAWQDGAGEVFLLSFNTYSRLPYRIRTLGCLTAIALIL